MKTIRVTPEDDAGRAQAVIEAVAVLSAGGVVAVPTETVYGLMADWSCTAARERIYRLKRRPREKRLQMLACDLRQAQSAGVRAVAGLDVLATRFWPGPLTVVVPGTGGDTIGLRLPDHPLLRQILQQAGRPVAATSANASGAPDAYEADAAVAGLDGMPDLLIDGGPVAGRGGASTVISLCGERPKILRPGPVAREEMNAVLGPVEEAE